jgi:hypothetical protein
MYLTSKGEVKFGEWKDGKRVKWNDATTQE